MPITSGKLTFQGKDVTNLKGRDRAEYWRDVQAVFQDPFSSFNQFFTVKKLLDRSMIMVGKKVGQERLEESLVTSAWTSPSWTAIRTNCPVVSGSG